MRSRDCPSYLTIATAARIAGVSATSVENWIAKGLLEVIKLGGGPDRPERSRRHVKLDELQVIMELRAERAEKRAQHARERLQEVMS